MQCGAPTPFRVVVEYPFTEGGGGVVAWDRCGFSRKPTIPMLRKRWGALICICDMVLIEDGGHHRGRGGEDQPDAALED